MNTTGQSAVVAPQTGRLGRRLSWTRTASVCLFMLLMLAAAHLLMVVVGAVDEHVSADRYAQAGVEAIYYGEEPIAQHLERLLTKASTAAERAPVEAELARVAAGQPVRLTMLPISPFLAAAAVGLSLLGFVLLGFSSRLESDAMQSLVGIFAGNLIWTGGVEYGLMIASRQLGVAKSLALVDGRVVGVFGEYVLLKHTWGVLLLVIGYVGFLESSRCPFFLWFRERMPLMRGSLANGRIDNFAPRTAFEFTTVVWTFYLLLLWAYDESVFGVHSWFTYLVFFGSFASSGYLLLRLHQRVKMGAALRYSVGTVVVLWNTIEIAAKWGLFAEPWLILHPATGAVFFGGLAFGAWLVVRAIRTPLPAVAT